MNPIESAGTARLRELEEEYQILGELGRGGTSVVYLARERELERDVAIKFVRASHLDDAEAVARLAREAKLIAMLRHPNVVPLLSTRHLTDGSLALVMQYVPGRTLKTTIREEGPLPIALVENVLSDITQALDYAHRRHGIVHRDIKPENIYIDEEYNRALLSDFGIARTGEIDSTLTLAGVALGTPAYMSPEQIDGTSLDGRSDLYSLGLVAYEMLTGRQPWEGCNLYTTIYKQKHEELPPLNQFRNDIPAHLERALEGLLRKDRAQRWSDAAQFLAQFRPRTTMFTPPKREAIVAPPLLAVPEDSPTISYERRKVEKAAAPEVVEPVVERAQPEPLAPAASAPEKVTANAEPASAMVEPVAAEVATEPPPVRPPNWRRRQRRERVGLAAVEVSAAGTLPPEPMPEPPPEPLSEPLPEPLSEPSIEQPSVYKERARSRLVASITLFLMLGGSAATVAMISGRDMASNAAANASATLTGDAAVTAAANRANAERMPTQEKASSPAKESERNERESSDQTLAVKLPTLAPPVIDATLQPEITAGTFSVESVASKLSSSSATESTPTNVLEKPVFTPYTVAPELKNRESVEIALKNNYPPLLRDARVGGTVELWALIDETGKVARTRVRQTSGHKSLDEAAVKVADVMQFTPAMNRGRELKVWVQLPVVFSAR